MCGVSTLAGVRVGSCFATAAVFVFLMALSNCGDRDRIPVELEPLPQVDLSTLDPELSEPLSRQLEILRSNPEAASPNGEAAKLLNAYQQFELAMLFYGRARSLEPANINWPYYQGVIHASQGRYDEAVAAFNAVLAMDPANLPAEKRLARALLDKGDLDASFRIYKKLIIDDPADPEIRAGIGRVNAALGNTEEAVVHLTRAVEMLPNYGEAHYALALAYRDLGDEDRAGEHFRRYEDDRLGAPIGVDPLMAAVNRLKSNALEYVRAGIEAQKAGRIREAIEYNLQALQLDPDLQQAHAGLIVLYGLAGDSVSARSHYQKALELNPNNGAVHYNYGRLSYDEGDYNQASAAFQRALEINPDDAFVNNNMGETQEQLGRLEDAIRYYRRAVANRPDYGHAHFNLGRTMMQQGRTADAVGEFQLALREEETFRTPTYLATLASAYAKLGKTREAADTFVLARQTAQRYGQDELVRTINGDIARLDGQSAP